MDGTRSLHRMRSSNVIGISRNSCVTVFSFVCISKSIKCVCVCVLCMDEPYRYGHLASTYKHIFLFRFVFLSKRGEDEEKNALKRNVQRTRSSWIVVLYTNWSIIAQKIDNTGMHAYHHTSFVRSCMCVCVCDAYQPIHLLIPLFNFIFCLAIRCVMYR